MTVEQIRQADAQAVGHIDYANKLALYCAEIAIGIERTPSWDVRPALANEYAVREAGR